ncbi:hypothetical protein ACFLYS_00120 [Chloroflexota bacterium]
MIEVGVISEKIADIATRKLEQIATERKAINQQNTQRVYTSGKTTKKAMAYQLFKEGKMSSSPEVRVLGLHKSTRCKYYRQWEADGKP